MGIGGSVPWWRVGPGGAIMIWRGQVSRSAEIQGHGGRKAARATPEASSCLNLAKLDPPTTQRSAEARRTVIVRQRATQMSECAMSPACHQRLQRRYLGACAQVGRLSGACLLFGLQSSSEGPLRERAQLPRQLTTGRMLGCRAMSSGSGPRKDEDGRGHSMPAATCPPGSGRPRPIKKTPMCYVRHCGGLMRGG